MNPTNLTQDLIRQECNAVRNLLLQKNEEYGDSAINPLKIFSTVDAVEQINVRIDDKLSRIKNHGSKTIKEDTVQDLIGYLILRRVAERIDGADDRLEMDACTIGAGNETILNDEWRIFWQNMGGDNE